MFREGFVWGAGSSAYQIEGGADAGGRGPSVWDTFCRVPGAVHQGETGAVACDHYHRFGEDVSLMSRIGLQAYRFSISWSRVLPDGVGRVSATGLGFYDRLVDALLAAGIEPWVTLFHWDFPYELYLRGGWLNPDSPRWFAEYTRVVVDRLSDRVSKWITINEPQIFVWLGHRDGVHAPGLKMSLADTLLVGHHALLAHGRSVQTIRAHAKTPPCIGWAPCGAVKIPVDERPETIEAARRGTLSVSAKAGFNNTWWADPILRGHYPEDGLRLFGDDSPKASAEDMRTMHQPLDFYGLNIYSGEPVRAGPDGSPVRAPFPPGHPVTAMRWAVAPAALRWGPRFIAERYRLPIVITENGMANLDSVSEDGSVRDPQRIDYTKGYLREFARAAAEGVDAMGYFHWSVMDNFEWAEGYDKRFGLIHVDYATQRRTLKDSAHWYRAVIESNGAVLARDDAEAVASGRPTIG